MNYIAISIRSRIGSIYTITNCSIYYDDVVYAAMLIQFKVSDVCLWMFRLNERVVCRGKVGSNSPCGDKKEWSSEIRSSATLAKITKECLFKAIADLVFSRYIGLSGEFGPTLSLLVCWTHARTIFVPFDMHFVYSMFHCNSTSKWWIVTFIIILHRIVLAMKCSRRHTFNVRPSNNEMELK